jgi:prophage antirepressor-like protein
MPNNEIVPFTFEEVDVRTIYNDGDPWFVLRDVMAVLGLTNPTEAVRGLDDDEFTTTELSLDGQRRNYYIISEPGLYALIARSRKPIARQFDRWVRHDVLPEIRRTGAYGQNTDLALPQNYVEALEALLAREKANLELEQANAELTPRAIAWDAIASAEGDYSVGEAAKILARAGVQNIGPTRLFQRLADLGWTYRGAEGTWMAYAERIDRGHLAHKPQFHYHPRTRERVVDPPQLRVTLKGIELLRQRLGAVVLKAVS